MKYMMIIYANQELWESFPAEEWPARIAAVEAFNKKLVEGHGYQLARPCNR
jgi:hypothetical protein